MEGLNVSQRYLNDIRGAVVESSFFDSNEFFIRLNLLVSYMKANCCFLICHKMMFHLDTKNLTRAFLFLCASA